MLNKILYSIFGERPTLVRAAKLAVFVGLGAAVSAFATEFSTAEGAPEATAAVVVIVAGALEKFFNSQRAG